MIKDKQLCLHAWDDTNKRWLPLLCDASGNLKLDLSNVNLGDLADVYVPSPVDQYYLYWNNTNGRYELQDPNIPVYLGDLADVYVPSPADGDVLYWNDGNSRYELKQISVPVLNNGTYAGNSTANRAIPHGLGVTPKCVLIMETGGAANAFMMLTSGWILPIEVTWNTYAVTAWDSTNFYVGNSSQYLRSANYTGRNYAWFAIG